MINSTGTLFVKFQYEETDDITVLPVQVYFDFYAGFKKGIGSTYGHDQEVSVELIDVNIKAFPCQFLPTERPDEPEDQENSGSSDFDEDESKQSKSGPRVHSIVSFVCMNTKRINNLLQEQKKVIRAIFKNRIYEYVDINQRHNAYYVFEELE